MNEKYIKSIIEILCQAYSYNILEIQQKEGLITPWGAINTSDNIVRVLVFAQKEANLEAIQWSVEKEIRNNYCNNDVKVVPIIITDDSIVGSDYSSSLRTNSIIIDNKSNRIVFNSEENIQTAKELKSILNWKAENSKKYKKMPVTFGIIGVNIFVFLLTAIFSGNLFDMNINVLIAFGAKVNYFILQGEYYRLITCMFLHGGLIHVALNMYALYNIGPLVEEVYGKAKYLIVYFAAGITSSVFSFVFSDSVSVGASGAIFGLLGITLVFAVREKEKIGKEFYKNILMAIVTNLIIGLSIANIDNFGHLGGLIGGIIVGVVYMIIDSKKIDKERYGDSTEGTEDR